MSKKIQQKKPAQQPLFSIEIKFDRSNCTYKPEQTVSGSISLRKRQYEKFTIDIQQIKLLISGKVKIQNRQNKPIINQLISMAPKITMLNETIQICQQNRINQSTCISFKFKLNKDQQNDQYLESYIGVFVAVLYQIKVEVKFTDAKIEKLQQEFPFYVQVPNSGRQLIENFNYPKPKYFFIKSDDIKSQMTKNHRFKIRGELESQIIYFSDYLLGKITIEMCQAPIRSIDLQMLRNQKINSSGKYFNQITQIQLIQLCDGDATRNIQLPIYMILPTYYSCPSIQYKWLTVTFQINLVVGFRDGVKVTANIPLKLIRS